MKIVLRIVPILVFALAVPTLLVAADAPTPEPDGTPPDFSQIPEDALVPIVCFAQGTDPAQVASHHGRFQDRRLRTSLNGPPDGRGPGSGGNLGGVSHFEFNDGDRWSATTLSGGGLTQGDPTIITWSIVPDGTSIFGYAGEATAPSNLRAFLNSIYGSQAVWLPLFQQVFDRWSELNGVTYVFEPNDDGSPWTSTTIAGGVAGVRGDVRIAGHTIDGTSGILAYNFFPDFGDMVIDTADATYTNLANNSRILRNVLAHEHGHGLGLSHVCPVNQTKLMEPFLATRRSPVRRHPGHQPGLRRLPGAQRLAGDRLGPGLALPGRHGHAGQPERRRQQRSRFPVVHRRLRDQRQRDHQPAGEHVSLRTAKPQRLVLGGHQLQRSQSPRPGSGDPGHQRHYGAGQLQRHRSARLSNVALPGAGTYFVRVDGPNNEAQLYELDLQVGATGGGANLAFANVTIDEVIRTVSVSGFSTPRVVMGPPSFAGSHPSTIRVRNVGATSFQHNLQEWDYLDGGHVLEDIGYLVLDHGAQSLGSLDAEAGSASVDEAWVTVSFSQSFTTTPVVLGQVASFNGSQAAEVRIRNVSSSGFQIRVQEEEGNDDNHVFERVDWIAVEPGTTTFGGNKLVVGLTGNSVTHDWFTISYSTVNRPVFLAEMQTFDGSDPAALRHRNLSATSVQVKVEEEQSNDTETNHTTEVVGYLVIGSP